MCVDSKGYGSRLKCYQFLKYGFRFPLCCCSSRLRLLSIRRTPENAPKSEGVYTIRVPACALQNRGHPLGESQNYSRAPMRASTGNHAFLDCGGLPPLSAGRLAARASGQARMYKSGGKPPQSNARFAQRFGEDCALSVCCATIFWIQCSVTPRKRGSK